MSNLKRIKYVYRTLIIQKLASYCGVKLKSGLCIEIEQNEMLRILPHECRRENKKVFIPTQH
jgi:hypothetical protein